MTTRADIAAAATLVAGVNVSPYFRQNLKAGDGFVTFVSRARGDNGFGFVDTWGVFVAIPQDVKAAEEWLDANLDTLLAELDVEILVQTVAPDTFTLPGGASVNAVSITGTREA